MLVATKGIVFNSLKYSENSLICRIYTEQLGIKSYLINTPKGRKKRMALYQPLTMLDLVVYNKENKNLNRIKEMHCEEPLLTVPHNVFKSTAALFVAEILYKAVKEEEPNAALYSFIRHFVKLLDVAERNYADYHLVFLIHLTQFLGFYPKSAALENVRYFDMVEGRFCSVKPLHSACIEQPLSTSFYKLLHSDYHNTNKLMLNGSLRQQLLQKILLYYKIHLEGMGSVKSAEVLKSVFHD